jgi:sterol 3beta-glucosyltransferase
MVRELEAACAAADVLVSLPFQLAGFLTHERCGIPHVAWSFSPFGALPGAPLGQATRDIVNQARLAVGLDALADPLAEAVVRSQLALFATSRHVFRRPRHWPGHYHLTGYFHLDEAWQPAGELARFLDSGSRPVVVTFGSMRHPDPEAVSRILVDAVERLGCRAVIQTGWSGLGSAMSMPRVHWAEGFIPHNWLFPRASCVVHHGAAGTTAAAVKAGVPSVIVPHALDQPLWAELMRACGAAACVIPFRELNADRLASAIENAASWHARDRMARLAECIRQEDGTKQAVALIEGLIEDRA